MRYKPALSLALAGTLVLAAACDKTGAMGDATSLIVAAPQELWVQIQDSVDAQLEPTIFTVRNEKAFQVTHQDPTGEAWANLRRFVQVLAVGTPDDFWVAEALDEGDYEGTLNPPEIIQVHNVWARNQQVTILLLPEENQVEALNSLLPELREIMDRQFRQWARNRMFFTGRDTALADTLRQLAGFSVMIPQVYYWDRQDSLYLFRNDNPDPSELIRQVAVTWRTPPPEELGQEYLLGWRDEIVTEYYSQDQVVDSSTLRSTPATYRDNEAFVIQGVWQNPPEGGWPAAGPFITRGVVCPEQDRAYILDAWLYAPGREKYEYMIQLETILDSFQCGS